MSADYSKYMSGGGGGGGGGGAATSSAAASNVFGNNGGGMEKAGLIALAIFALFALVLITRK